MASALVALRGAIARGDKVDIDATHVLVGDGTRLDRKLPTGFRSMRGRGEPYSLETVFFQYKHHALPYNDYLRECHDASVPHVTLVDKKDLIAYLKGKISTCAGLAASSAQAGEDTREDVAAGAPERNQQDDIRTARRSREDAGLPDDRRGDRSAALNGKPGDESAEGRDGQREQHAEDMDSKNRASPRDASLASRSERLSGPDGDVGKLDQVSAPDSANVDAAQGDGKDDSTHAKTRKVRDQRALDAVMCVPEWDFSNIRDGLAKHLEAKRSKANGSNASKAANGTQSTAPTSNGRSADADRKDMREADQRRQYDPRGDRYTATDDRFWRENMGSDFYEMGIDPSGTFKSGGSSGSGGGRNPSAGQPSGNPPSRGADHSRRPRYEEPPSKRPRFSARDQRPIIVVPNSQSAMITFINGREFFEEGSFVETREMRRRGAATTSTVARMRIRRKPGGNCDIAEYEVVCVPSKLTESEWDRVVAVVCIGQAWQFKGWPDYDDQLPDKGISNILRKTCGMVFHYDDSPPPRDSKNWPVKFLPLSRTRRHDDIKLRGLFWDYIDAHCKHRFGNGLRY